MIVVHASVLAVALADDGADGDHARARLRGEDLAAADLVDLEVVSVLRGRARSGGLDERRALPAIDDLTDLPLRRFPHTPFLRRCWELRENLSVYDTVHVALAEAAGCALLTADGRLARAPGPRCAIEVLDPAAPVRSGEPDPG